MVLKYLKIQPQPFQFFKIKPGCFQFQSQKLKDENFVLKKNISSLYLTAREEIKRKDAQIRNLQDKEVRNRKILAKSQQ